MNSGHNMTQYIGSVTYDMLGFIKIWQDIMKNQKSHMDVDYWLAKGYSVEPGHHEHW